MRPFEFTLIVGSLIALFVPYKRAVGFGRFLALLLVAVLIAHIVQESARWQMLPVYLVALGWIALVLFSIGLPKWIGRFGIVIGIFFALTSLILAALLPVPPPPPITGPYAIGTATYHLVQTGRPEIFSADPNDSRELMMQVWYPAEVSDQPIANYLPNSGVGSRENSKMFALPPFLLNHLRLIKPNARVEPLLAPSDSPFPLLIFSHGRSGTRIQNTQQVEELVSNGYIVAAVDHAYGAGYTVYPDGRTILYDRSIFGDDSPQQAGLVVDEWVKDFQFMLDKLNEFTQDQQHLLANSINFSQIGVFGHSTGGGAAYEFCYRDQRCGAVLGYDPWLIPTSDQTIDNGLNKPLMVIKQNQPLGPVSDARLERMIDNSTAEKYIIRVADTRHFDFTDFKHLSPKLNWFGLTGTIEAKKVRQIMNSYSLAFFDYHLRGWQGALLFADSAEFPEVNFEKP